MMISANDAIERTVDLLGISWDNVNVLDYIALIGTTDIYLSINNEGYCYNVEYMFNECVEALEIELSDYFDLLLSCGKSVQTFHIKIYEKYKDDMNYLYQNYIEQLDSHYYMGSSGY